MATRMKKTPGPQTYEELLASAKNSYSCRPERLWDTPAPTYTYTPGEKVHYGALHDVKVEEVLTDGKLVHISHHDRGESYGRPYDNNRRLPMIVWWYDIEPIATVTDTRFARPDHRASYTQTDLRCLMSQAYHRGLIESPVYQREYVWTLADKQRLIRSIFNKTDIGKFVYMVFPGAENRMEVVDGKQRLRAIMDFYEGRFEFEGCTWFQLSRHDKREFMSLMVQAATIQREHVKDSDVLWLFLSLNTGGVPQTDEHIAKAWALYQKALDEEKKAARENHG